MSDRDVRWVVYWLESGPYGIRCDVRFRGKDGEIIQIPYEFGFGEEDPALWTVNGPTEKAIVEYREKRVVPEMEAAGATELIPWEDNPNYGFVPIYTSLWDAK